MPNRFLFRPVDNLNKSHIKTIRLPSYLPPRSLTLYDLFGGFEIAERDLELRGEGDVFGNSQSGQTEMLQVANILRDKDLLYAAREDLLDNDYLEHVKTKQLIEKLKQSDLVTSTV